MKGQQLFHCFLPGVTVAILTTQPTLANSVTVSGIKQTNAPSMVVSTNGGNLSALSRLPLSSKITNNPIWGSDHDLSAVVSAKQPSLPLIMAARNGNVNSLKVRINNNNKVVNVANNSNNDCSQSLGKNQGFIDFIWSMSPLCHSQKSANYQLSQVTGDTNTQKAEKTSETVVPITINTNSPQTPDNSQEKPVAIPVKNESQKTPDNSQEKPVAIPVKNESQKTPNNSQEKPVAIPVKNESQKASDNAQQQPVVIPVKNESQKASDNSQEKPETTNSQVPNNLDPSSNPLLFPTKDEEVKIQQNQPLTLEQALELARRNNNNLRVSLLELEKSKSYLKEAQANFLPTVDVSGSISRSRDASSTLSAKIQQTTNPLYPDATESSGLSGTAQLTYNLYTSGKRNALVQEAQERIKSQELEVEKQYEEIRLNVATAYYDLQQADEQVRIYQSSVENAKASLKDANALERAGVGTKFDVLRSQVTLANSQQNLTSAISQQQIARRRLVSLLNLPQSVTISAADPVKLAGLWQHTLEKSIVLAYQNRPELQQNLVKRNIGYAQRKQALAALGPQVSLVAKYNLLDQFDDNVSVVDGYSVGVQASLSLYDGGAAKAKAAQAKSDIAVAETEFSEQRNQIRYQVEQAYANQLSNLENVQTSNVALEQAKESLRLARLRFQAGVGTQTDVINAQNDLTTAEGNKVKAILDYNKALTQLQRYVTLRGMQSVSQ